jgi:alkylation response protein AidB-like acyl-CoA dehydrogenase
VTSTTEEAASVDSPEQATFRAGVRTFLAEHSQPRRETSPWALNFHTDPDDARRAFERGRAWQRTRFEHGMTGFTYPKEVGGQGGEAWQERIYEEEAAEYEASSGFIRSTIMMLGPTLMAFGTDAQQRELVPRLLSGEDAWCQLFSEPGAGSDLASLGCRAVRDGDDFVVNGQKVWNSAAQWCDHGMLLARTNPDAPKHHGITFLLVDMRSPGIEARPLIQATGAAHFNEVFFEDVRVPVANVLGEIDGGWAAARTVMANESAMIGGSGSSTFTNLLLLAQEFGRTDDPVVRQRLADYYARERALGLLADRIMTAVRRRERPPVDPSILKLFIALNRALSGDVAASIAGPAGLLEDDEVSRWVGAELLGRYGISIGGGTNEVQRNNLAERALGLPKEPATDRGVPWSETLRS